VATKIKNPDWYRRPGVKIPYGHPDNILGTRWLGFRNSPEYRGFGIHGTSDPASIGRAQSSGCVRMLNADIETLYEWAAPGTVVRIHP
jgi:lipoprotein-anchoring transpeptidase ErfK/SrfK